MNFISKNISYRHFVFYFSILLIFFSTLDIFIPGLRYIKYLLPIFVVFFWFSDASRRYRIRKEKILFPFIFLMVYCCFQLMFIPDLKGIKDLFFIFTYTLPFLLFAFPNQTKDVDLVFILFIVFFILKLFFIPMGEYSFVDSSGVFEGTESFVFGVFSIYYLSRNRLVMYLICLLLIFLTLKRIVIIAVFFASLSVFFNYYINNKFVSRVMIFLLANFLLVILILFGQGAFDDVINTYFGLSVNHFTMGRFIIYSYVMDELGSTGFFTFFGNGIGSSYDFVNAATSGFQKNLHSDLLKIYFEGGIFLYGIFFLLFASVYNNKASSLSLLLLIYFFTDNVLIYVHVMFFFLYIASAICVEENNISPKLKI